MQQCWDLLGERADIAGEIVANARTQATLDRLMELGFADRVANFEIELITEALKDTRGNQSQAAKRLGLSKRMIQYKIRLYGIDWQRFK